MARFRLETPLKNKSLNQLVAVTEKCGKRAFWFSDLFPREARDLVFVPDTNHKQTPKELEWHFWGDFGMGRAAEGAREANFGGFWDGL